MHMYDIDTNAKIIYYFTVKNVSIQQMGKFTDTDMFEVLHCLLRCGGGGGVYGEARGKNNVA